MPGLPIVFFILAIVSIGTAVGVLVSRNTIYSALFLVLNFATVAMLYLILGAPFIALSQLTVYAGSIMILFLFVIMLLGVSRLDASENLRWQPLLAIPLGIVLIAEFSYQLYVWANHLPAPASVSDGFGAPLAVGETLFTQFTLPFEVTGAILLSATVGAIILARPDRSRRKSRLSAEEQTGPGNQNVQAEAVGIEQTVQEGK